VRRIEVPTRLDDPLIDRIDRLLAAAGAGGRRPVDPERWDAVAGGPLAGAVVAVAFDDDDDDVVGYAHALPGPGGWTLDRAVDPARRGADTGIGAEVVRAVLDAVADAGDGRAQLWVRDPDTADDAEAEAAGLGERRDLYQMRCSLPTGAPPPALALRPFRPGHDGDADAWLAVNNRAFSWHPDQGGWDRATLEARLAEPWFDPAGFLLHERDGRLAGFCWTKVHAEEDPPVGEIYVIAVDPSSQGTGLGRDLVLAGLDHLAGRGLSTGMLYVDATNTGAVRLYEALGFTVAHVDRAYGGDVSR
jgi:mycothiol synthase